MMIADEAFPVEPWVIRETELRLDLLPQTESLFALSNGHIGLRGNLDEGEPYGLPGTYLNGYYETRPLPYGEAGYGDPEDGQSSTSPTASSSGCWSTTNHSTFDTASYFRTKGFSTCARAPCVAPPNGGRRQTSKSK